MEELNTNKSNDTSKKQKGRAKKYKSSLKLFTKTYWPKVMISRNSFVYKKSKDSPRATSLMYLEEPSDKFSVKEDVDVERLCCEESVGNFKEDQGVCLISSSSEILCKSSRENENNLQKAAKSNEDDRLACATRDDETSKMSGSQERLIFVDLTADEKSTWKQTIFKRFDDVDATDEKDNEVLEPQIMIADSSSKLNPNGGRNIATALSDREPYVIPVQPNHSLPIRPVPCVPPRRYTVFRKNYSPLLVLSKSSTTDVVEVEEPIKPLNEATAGGDFDEEHVTTRESVNPVDYVVPQISSVGSLSEVKIKSNENSSHERENLKESRKRKKSQEADSTQREERVGSSIIEYLEHSRGSNLNEGEQKTCTDRCSNVVSTSKEEGNKVVPPLRLKKVVHTDIKSYASRSNTKVDHKSNYRIITGATPRPSSSPILSNWSNAISKKDTNYPPLSNDTYKLEYRRKKLKQKLHELRDKALELTKQMANDSSSQQSTKLRQVMNRYEKQIQNLSKLHGKLSAALPVPSEVINVNDDAANPLDDDEDLLKNFNETDEKNGSPCSSPEPPKLSPHSPINYEKILPEEVNDSPPILPKANLTISSSHDLVEEELQNSESKIWSREEERLKLSLQDNKTSSDYEKCVRSTPPRQQSSIDMENPDFDINKISLSCSEQVTQLSMEKEHEKSRLMEEFPQAGCSTRSKAVKCLDFSKSGPVIDFVIGDIDEATSIQNNEMVESEPSEKQHPLLGEHLLQPNFFESNQEGASFSEVNENTQSVLQVPLDLNQRNQFTALNQAHLMSQQNYKGGEISDNTNYPITEQFPSLSNWLARMSKKPSSKSKSTLQSMENISFTSMKNPSHISEGELPKMVGPSTANSSINPTPQYTAERWQYHQQQQSQQQLLQHLAASITLSQPTSTIPPLRPAIHPSIPMTQFYPNNYAIDPYNNAALNYHSTIWPYNSYPYHSRLHSSSLPGFHFPVQESLRPLQHIDKVFPSVQEEVLRYPPPSTSLQHPTNLHFNRMRGTARSNVATCLPSLFVSPTTVSTSHPTLPRPLIGYPTNGQFSRNRIIPDVVAAAAAAAVVAAASIHRQRDTYNNVTYNRNDTNPLTNVLNEDTARVTNPNKTMIGRDTINQPKEENFSEESHNFVCDRLKLVQGANNFTQTNSLMDNNGQRTLTTIVSTPYQTSLTSTYSQLPQSVTNTEFRICDTPHLEKVSHSPNSSQNFTCSNCSKVGPKFKCLGCAMAFYCDEKCQENHWYVHVQRCPKKMPKLKKVT